MMTLDKLELLAKAASPAPWTVDNDWTYQVQDAQGRRVVDAIYGSFEKNGRADTAFIAAFNPARALTMIALLREAKKAVVSLKGLLECDEFRDDEQDGIAHCQEWLANLAAFEESDHE